MPELPQKSRFRRQIVQPESQTLEPTSFIKRFGSRIAQAAGSHPVVDVACGSGRNAIFLAQLGSTVICVDKDLSRLPDDKVLNVSLIKQQLDLIADQWPFGAETIGGIVLVDFLYIPLFPFFNNCLIAGGCFLLETVSGRGGNYLELPRTGELLTAAEKAFDIEVYKESRVGPPQLQRVSVKMLARCRKT